MEGLIYGRAGDLITVSLTELIEQAVADPNQKNLTGSLEDFMRLLGEENLARLEAAHQGAFAFLVFHPSADGYIADYLRRGTLGSDSGPKVLAFVTLDEDAMSAPSSPVPDGVAVDGRIHIAYEVTRSLFSPQAPPPLPGVVFTGGLSGANDAVYTPLGDVADEDDVRSRLRLMFSLADQALDASRDRSDFPDRFAKALVSEGIAYQRSGRRSLAEWVARSYHLIVDHGLEWVTVLGGVFAGQGLS